MKGMGTFSRSEYVSPEIDRMRSTIRGAVQGRRDDSPPLQLVVFRDHLGLDVLHVERVEPVVLTAPLSRQVLPLLPDGCRRLLILEFSGDGVSFVHDAHKIPTHEIFDFVIGPLSLEHLGDLRTD